MRVSSFSSSSSLPLLPLEKKKKKSTSFYKQPKKQQKHKHKHKLEIKAETTQSKRSKQKPRTPRKVQNRNTKQQTHKPNGKPTNPDLPNPNPLAWTKPRQQRLQAKDLCRGFLLLQGKVSFSSVSFFLSFFLFIFYFLFFVEQKLESLILKFHTTSWKSWGHLLPLFKQ